MDPHFAGTPWGTKITGATIVVVAHNDDPRNTAETDGAVLGLECLSELIDCIVRFLQSWPVEIVA